MFEETKGFDVIEQFYKTLMRKHRFDSDHIRALDFIEEMVSGFINDIMRKIHTNDYCSQDEEKRELVLDHVINEAINNLVRNHMVEHECTKFCRDFGYKCPHCN